MAGYFILPVVPYDIVNACKVPRVDLDQLLYSLCGRVEVADRGRMNNSLLGWWALTHPQFDEQRLADFQESILPGSNVAPSPC